MTSLTRLWMILIVMLAFGAGELSQGATAPLPGRAAVIRYAAESGRKVWRKAQNPEREKPDSRDLFTYALALCEAGQNLERLDTLFSVGAQMQDRDPKSRGFGNFRWNWTHDRVMDYNAVDFCMQGASLIWLRHRDQLPAATREKLHEILKFAVQGCLRHKVAVNYTNIVLMNAVNLILLGEGIGDPAAAAEGYARLERAALHIELYGIHEYDSPTYYGVDLDDLEMLEAFCATERGRQVARALLEFFWTDIALNWHPGAQKLAGTRSRDYDYLRGLGMLDTQLWVNGWLEGEPRGSIGAIYPALARWSPPARLRELSQTRFPRLVRQSWSDSPAGERTHYLMKNVTLSASGEAYGGRMDLPLTADLAGPRESVRCYFIPDGRHDPYGKSKIPDRSGHEKTFHLQPFYAGAQCRRDALGLAVYRNTDIPTETLTLESHFVMPRQVDEFWIGEKRVTVAENTPLTVTLRPGEALALRKGAAAVGVRVPWARDCDGLEALARFIYDGNPYGAVRLTVDHRLSPKKIKTMAIRPGAAFWVRIGDGLGDGAAFAKWRAEFAAARPTVEATSEKIQVRVPGQDGPVAAGAAAPFKVASVMEPAPAQMVLALDGVDLGKEILANVVNRNAFQGAEDGKSATKEKGQEREKKATPKAKRKGGAKTTQTTRNAQPARSSGIQ